MASTSRTTATFSFGTPITASTYSTFGTPVTTIGTFGFGSPVTATTSSIFTTPATKTDAFGFYTPVTSTTSSIYGTPVTTKKTFDFGIPITATNSSIFTTPVTSATATFGAGTSVAATASSMFGTPVTTTASKVLDISHSTAVSEIPITRYNDFHSVLPDAKRKLDFPVETERYKYHNAIGLIQERHNEFSFEWAIPDFFSWDEIDVLCSPEFHFLNFSLNLRLYWGGMCWVNLFMAFYPTGSMTEMKDLLVSVAVKQPGECRIYNWKKMKILGGFTYMCPELFKRSDIIERKSEFLPSGTLTIACSVQKGKRDSFEDKLKSLEILSSDFKDLYLTKSQCDVSIKVKDTEFKAHKTILSARSSVFASAFEHDMQEKNTGVINIEDCDPYSFGDFLRYLYTGEIGDLSFKIAHGLYVTADKYNVKELKSSCTSYILYNLALDNVCDVLALADLYDEIGLMSSAEDYFRRNYSKIVSTAEWELLLKTNYRLANKVLRKVVSSDEVPKTEGIHKNSI